MEFSAGLADAFCPSLPAMICDEGQGKVSILKVQSTEHSVGCFSTKTQTVRLSKILQLARTRNVVSFEIKNY
jgi:hypothetical protein